MNTKIFFSLLLVSFQFDALAQGVWYVTPEGLGMKTGKDWLNASDNLHAIIDSTAQGDEIWVAAGRYFPSVPHGGGWGNDKTFYINKNIKIYGGFKGVETSESQRDWASNPTVLSGDLNGDDADSLSGLLLLDHGSRQENVFHVLWLDQVSDSMILSGFYIEGGNGDHPSNDSGGGIYIAGAGAGHFSSPSIEHCTFQRNAASYRGGAIFNDGSEGGTANMRVIKCTFLDNYSRFQGGGVFNSAEYGGVSNPYFLSCNFKNQESELDGGAVFNSGIAGGICSPAFDSCVFENNSTVWNGGAIMNFAHSGTANPQFAACHFRGNTSLYGGAIHNSGIENGLSSPILTSCTFEGNAAQSYGGAVYNDGKDGNSSPKFKNCRFSSNSSAFHGGAIYNNGDDGVSSPTIKSCVFESNFANAGGGAIFNHGDAGTSSPMIDSCVFTKNTTEGGGGAICNFSSSQGYVNPIISQCLFSENSAPAGVGGAIWDSPPYGTCKPVYSNCVFADNSAGNGGAFKSSGGAGYSPMLLNCVFAKNAAVKYGGAMSYIWEGGTYPTLINCAFWGNTAEEGGGLYGFSNPSAHPRVINCSFSNNRATTYGGAMNNRTCDGCSTPDFAINNCVFWDNHAPAGKSMYNSWATPQLFHTLLQETICPPGAYCHTPSMLYNQDPLFLDQNGNMRLQAGSPAINTGQNAALPDSVQYDLDGNLRIMGPAVDRGAYEFEEAVGVKYALANAPMQNFDITPNPFSEQADIQFLLTEGAHIRLRIIDLFGNPLMDRARYYPPGYHHETFQSESKVPSGILFCEIITPSGGSVIKKIIQLDRH